MFATSWAQRKQQKQKQNRPSVIYYYLLKTYIDAEGIYLHTIKVNTHAQNTILSYLSRKILRIALYIENIF